MHPDRRRLSLGLLLSLLFHALLLSLTFGGQGLGLPGFGFPWQERRAEVPELRVVLGAMPASVPATEALPGAAKAANAVIAQPVAAKPAMTPLAAPAPPPAPAVLVSPAPAPVLPPSERQQESTPLPKPTEDLVAVARSDQATWTVPPEQEVPVPVTAVVPSAPSSEMALPPLRDAGDARLEAQRQAQRVEAERQQAAQQVVQQAVAQQAALQVAAQAAAREDVARQEAARQDAARLEASRAETERKEVLRQEAARQAAAQQTARQEASRQEAVRQEAAQQETARAEAARAEAAKVEAAKIEGAKVEAAKVEAAKAQAGRQDAAKAEAAQAEGAQQVAAQQGAARADAGRPGAARQEAGLVEAARLAAIQAEAEKRDERLRAIGRQLNEEADRREAAAAAQRQLPAGSSVRRGRLYGRTDANAELIAYAEAWGRKIQLNMTFDMVREAAKQPHTQPLVTVAIRSDGSVESVTFVTSSGVAAIDEAIRRIVQSQANYPAFPPGLLRDFDVVEIRRTWQFDMAIRLY
jgi:TonB family protein